MNAEICSKSPIAVQLGGLVVAAPCGIECLLLELTHIGLERVGSGLLSGGDGVEVER